MSEYDTINDEQVRDISEAAEDLLDGMSDRITDTIENIAELADDVEELSSEIKSLLDDLRAVQSRIEPRNRDKLEPLIDQLEGVYKELETAVWTMDCATEGLPEDIDLLDMLEKPTDGVD
jgi:ABC-type transporter Mla subunit MlaD